MTVPHSVTQINTQFNVFLHKFIYFAILNATMLFKFCLAFSLRITIRHDTQRKIESGARMALNRKYTLE